MVKKEARLGHFMQICLFAINRQFAFACVLERFSSLQEVALVTPLKSISLVSTVIARLRLGVAIHIFRILCDTSFATLPRNDEESDSESDLEYALETKTILVFTKETAASPCFLKKLCFAVLLYFRGFF